MTTSCDPRNPAGSRRSDCGCTPRNHPNETLVALTALIDAESVTPVIEATYAWADTAEAIRQLTERHAGAKIVIALYGQHRHLDGR